MININTYGTTLEISYFNENGSVEIDRHVVPKSELFEWQSLHPNESSNYTERNWYGDPVVKKPTKYLNNYRVKEYMLQHPEIFSKYYHYHRPNIWFCDIETAYVNGRYSDPEIADNPVLTITLVSSKGSVIVLGTKPLPTGSDSVIRQQVVEHFSNYPDVESTLSIKYIHAKTEYDMLNMFFTSIVPKIGCLTGWNFIDYDWMYLATRAKKLEIDPAMASPVKSYSNRKLMLPMHKLVFDYMKVYSKWDRRVKVKENVKLDYTASQVLNVKKVHYTGSLHVLYESDYVKFVLYNIIDAYLVKMIHDELKTANVLFSLAKTSLVPIEKAFSPVARTESHYAREFLKQRRVACKRRVNKEVFDYEGGGVSKPVIGRHRMVVLLDFSSLYPSIQRQFKISPETLIDSYVNVDQIPPDKIITCPSGQKFDASQPCVADIVLTQLFNERKDCQRQHKKLAQEIYELEKELKELEEMSV